MNIKPLADRVVVRPVEEMEAKKAQLTSSMTLFFREQDDQRVGKIKNATKSVT